VAVVGGGDAGEGGEKGARRFGERAGQRFAALGSVHAFGGELASDAADGAGLAF
jgi:hypothetical protein